MCLVRSTARIIKASPEQADGSTNCVRMQTWRPVIPHHYCERTQEPSTTGCGTSSGEGRAQLPQRQHVPLPLECRLLVHGKCGSGATATQQCRLALCLPPRPAWAADCCPLQEHTSSPDVSSPKHPPTHTEPLHSGKGGCTCCVSQLAMQGLGAGAHTLALERAQWVRGQWGLALALQSLWGLSFCTTDLQNH